MMAEMQKEFWETVGASTTQVMVDAAERAWSTNCRRAPPPSEVHHHWLESCKADYRGHGR